MKNKTSIYVLLFFGFLVVSCQDKDEEKAVIPIREGKYRTNYLYVEPPIDLNRDGTASEDLFEEIHWIQSREDFLLIIDHREDLKRRLLDLQYPYLYTDPNDPDFLNQGASAIFSDFVVDGNQLVTDNPAILSAIAVNDSTIEIRAVADFELAKGIKQVEMKATYVWAHR